MNPPLRGPNHQWRFHPRFTRRHIAQPNHAKQSKQRRVGFAERNRTPPDDPQSRLRRGGLDPALLRGRGHRKHADENSAAIQMRRRSGAVIGDVAPHFKTAGDFLRMIPFHPAARREIWRAAQDKIEFFLQPQNRPVTKVALTDFVAIFQTIPTRGFPREAHTFRLRFNCDKPRPCQAPCGNHSHCPQPTAKIKDDSSRRTTRRAIPRGQDVIRRKTMAFGQLKQSKVTADGVKRFARFKGGSFSEGSGRYRARLGPAFKHRFSVIVAQASRVGIQSPKRKSKSCLFHNPGIRVPPLPQK